jgi:hypothetical protein
MNEAKRKICYRNSSLARLQNRDYSIQRTTDGADDLGRARPGPCPKIFVRFVRFVVTCRTSFFTTKDTKDAKKD